MPKDPRLFEGGQRLWEHGRPGEGEESAPCGLEPVIIERNCDKLSKSLKGAQWHIACSPFFMFCTLCFASKRVISAGVVVRGRPVSLTWVAEWSCAMNVSRMRCVSPTGDPPFGKDFAVPRAEPRMAPMADMEAVMVKRCKHAFSLHT